MEGRKIIIFLCLGLVLLLLPKFLYSAATINDLLSSDGKILYGNEPNPIMVIDYPENIKQVEEYLKMVDIPPQQVLIEARVVEVKLEGEHSLGINWTAFANENGIDLGHYTLDTPISQTIPYKYTYYPPNQTSDGQESPFSLSIFDKDINAVIQTLSNTFDTNILSAPRITTLNNQEAEIKIIQKLPWAEPEVEMSDQGIAITWNINFEEVGIILKVTPMINEDGEITLELEPEVSEKVDDYNLTVVQGSTQIPYTVPVIDSRKADTKVRIKNGQTLIIGGLIKDKVIKGVSKVPLLGDMPGLGWMFKSKKDTKEKTELLIFVSPTLITPSVLADMGKKEKFDIGKWYMEERNEKKIKVANIEKKNREKMLDSLYKDIKSLVQDRKKLESDIEKEKNILLISTNP